MSGCPAYGDRLGGFVLGSLEPSEMDEMRRHVAECPQCGPEAGNLSSLPGLLDEIEPADVPPPTLSPAVEEAVLDRFVRERRPRRRRAQRRWLRLGGLVAACAAAAVLAIVLIGGSDDEGSTAYAWAELDPVAAGSGAAGSAWVNEVPAGTRVRLRASGLPEETYELWCVREDGSWVSGGTFRADARGKAEAVLTAAVRPGDYHVVVIAEDGGDGPHGAAMLRGRLKY